MRVELIYAPGCLNYSKARNTLEAVIAEERLPIPVELMEDDAEITGSPTIRIDGSVVNKAINKDEPAGFEQLREILTGRWKELTEKPLMGM